MNLRLLRLVLCALIVGTLAACASRPPAPPEPVPAEAPASAPAPASTAPVARNHPASRWVAVDWSALPGWGQDTLHEAWNAWLRSCERPAPAFAPLCAEVRRLSIGSQDEQRQWMEARLQPYRVEAPDGRTDGLLTGYYEPLLDAARQSGNGYDVPLYAPPAGLTPGQPWYTRQQIEQLPEARAQLAGRALAWVRDPVAAMALHIQGSGRLQLREADGSTRLVRLAFAATNGQPYQSIGKWLLDRALVRDATWPGISAWAQAHPERLQELLWANPRYVFFREEALSALDAGFGPRGAQGVALTPGRSIAVDRQSIPYGTPVWLASSGAQVELARLVLAQDTGSAIVGAVRADYFTGWGEQAGEIAGRLKQGLRLWTLWPK